MSAMIARVAATQATRDAWFGRFFAWGEVDCGQMLVSHLIAMGHVPSLPRDYRSLTGARKALRAMGFADLAAAMDGNGFGRIPPAAAIAGDVVQLPGDVPGAMTVCLGNGLVLGFHETVAGALIARPTDVLAAWRVEPA